ASVGHSDARHADARRAVDAGPRDGPEQCQPGQFLSCQDATTAIICNDQGIPAAQTCAFECNPNAMQCWSCDPAQPTTCGGDDTVVNCNADGQIPGTTACSGWCNPLDSPPGCAVIAPSNLPEDSCENLPQTSLTVRMASTFDTSNCGALGGKLVSQPSSGTVAP